MKRDSVRLGIFFALTALLGVLLHFLFTWSPNLLFALLSPVRESVWEHVKLIYWPLLLCGLVWTRHSRERRGDWYLAILASSALLLLSGWVLHIRMEVSALWADITLYVVVLVIGFAIALWLNVSPRWKSTLLLGVGVLGVLILLFTFLVPDTLLFADLSLADALYTLPC